jgi:hypothetical protein
MSIILTIYVTVVHFIKKTNVNHPNYICSIRPNVNHPNYKCDIIKTNVVFKKWANATYIVRMIDISFYKMD